MTESIRDVALEHWFRQKMMESHHYRKIGGWWQNGGMNVKGNCDDFEIDIVAETMEGEVEAYEVKRNRQKYNQTKLREKSVDDETSPLLRSRIEDGWLVDRGYVITIE